MPPPPTRARPQAQPPPAQEVAKAAPAPQSPADTAETRPAEGEGDDAETADEEESKEDEYTYDPGGRPDPFKSVLVRGDQKNTRFLPPLQQRDVSEMRLIAIVWGELGKMAMLQLPDGKGYSVKEGTKVGPNDGVIKKITFNEVIVRERFMDIFGEKQTREVVLELRPGGEEP